MKTNKILLTCTAIAILLSTQVQASDNNLNNNESLVFKTYLRHTTKQLQSTKSKISWNLVDKTIGNIFSVEKNELTVGCTPAEGNQKQIDDIYSQLNSQITAGHTGQGFDLSYEKQSHAGAFMRGSEYLRLSASESFVGEQAIFGSQGEIKLTSPKFDFDNCFLEVDPDKTVVKFHPHATTVTPIDFIECRPKRSVLFLDGKLDFAALTFGNFTVSNSEVIMHFKGLQLAAKAVDDRKA